MTDTQTETLYNAIGGDGTVRALTHRFYELMDTLPEAARCRAVHPADLSGSEEKFYQYLTGWHGGPPIYTDKRGNPGCGAVILSQRSGRRSAKTARRSSAIDWACFPGSRLRSA